MDINNQANDLVLLKFWAPWCGPCNMMTPIVEAVIQNHKDIKFRSVNVDEEPNMAVEYGIRSIPTLVVVKNGETVDRLIGSRSSEDIEQFIIANK